MVEFTMSDMHEFAYHCFPRRVSGESVESAHKRGFATLESMVKHGLLLTIELVQWPELYHGNQIGATTTASQRRLSFTQLPGERLSDHRKIFGDFALEFSIANLVHIGGVPVIYFPRPQAGQIGLEGVGSNMVNRLAEVRTLLAMLKEISHALVDAPGFKLENCPPAGGAPMIASFSTEETAGIRRFLASIPSLRGVSTFDHLLGGIDGVFSLFYYTDDSKYTVPLGYYQQREWRLLNCFHNNTALSHPATIEQVEELLKINAAFFGKQMQFAQGEEIMAKHCHFYPSLNGRHILSYVRRIFVPMSYEEPVKTMFRQYDLEIPVATK